MLASRGVCAQDAPADSAQSIDAVREGFLRPVPDARPMVRWWWFGPAVEKPEILHELQQMKADGIGGVELAFVYPEVLDDPAKGLKNFAFLSPEMLDAVKYAQAEGRMLGLRIDVTLCSGWPYGGSNTPLEEAAGRLKMVVEPFEAQAPGLSAIKLAAGDRILATFVAAGTPKRYEAAGALRYTGQSPPTLVSMAAGPRVVLTFIASHTRQQVKRAAVGAEGYVLDPFSRQAVATHLQKAGEPLLQAFGATPPYAIFSDSLEAYGADWTPALPEEFRKRRGYDLIPHLPELWAGGSPTAEKVRHDYGRTLTELVDENYLTQINDWARAHGTRFRSQTYGEPAVSLASQRLVGLPEGEGPQLLRFSTLRWATSANHLFGNKVTSGETYTWLHSPVFRATPLDMKAEADIDFLMGENQLIFHGWPYSPPLGAVGEPESAWPGWSLYAAAVFNDHNPWHPVMPAVTGYLTRISSLLRQGDPANQVAILLPTDDAWASFAPGKVSVTAAMQRLITPELMASILTAGYNADFTDADAIDRLGIHHQILVLPPTDRIPAGTLKRIDEWAARGGKVVAVGRLPTMNADGVPLSAAGVSTAAIPLVPDENRLGKALSDAAEPDMRIRSDRAPNVAESVGFIRRKLPDGDIYFVANTSNRTLDLAARFATKFRFGEQISPDSGVATKAETSDYNKLRLAPYESRIFLFGNREPRQEGAAGAEHEVADLNTGWTLTFTGSGKTRPLPTLTDWTSDPATLHYSGEAVYSREFTMGKCSGLVFLAVDGGEAVADGPNRPPEPNGLPDRLVTKPGPGMRAYFDPPVREAALVTVNGLDVGALWHPPYRLDVTKALRPGNNRIEIHVYNTLLNAWSAQPPHDYRPLKAKYGDRFQMQDLEKVRPVSSGLLGKVTLVEGGR